ncbi:MAG: helix-turn-helix domain-containing protein [Solirubrobacteraceae bacterium]
MKIAITVEIPDEEIERVVARAVARVLDERAPADDGWLASGQAAAYLGLPSTNALHKLTAARKIAFEQDKRGGKCWFRRSDLDAYRRGERASQQLRAV